MRTVSMKSLCLLAGFLVPCFGTATRAEAGVIPWLYNSIFGHGWGNNYGGGYGGGMPYSAGYGGYNMYSGGGYGAMMPYTPAYSSYGYSGASSSCGCGTGISTPTPVYSQPTYSTPTPVNANPAPNSPPTSGEYKLEYGPTLGYSNSSDGYYTSYGPTYSTDPGSCCVPCNSCASGDCATSIQPSSSSRPAANPTPVEPVVPQSKIKKGLPPDDMVPATGAGSQPPEESLPPEQRRPMKQQLEGVGNPTEMQEPAIEETPPAGKMLSVPTDSNIVIRYAPSLKRSRVALPASAARVVRVDRSTREQLIRDQPKPQLASNR